MPAQPIHTLSHLGVEMFRQEIMPAGQPVLIKGAVADWPLVKMSKDLGEVKQALRDGASSRPADIIRADRSQVGRFFYANDMSGFNFERAKVSLGAFLDQIDNNPDHDAIYMGATPLAPLLPSLASDMVMPLVPDHVQPLIWLGNESVVSAHYDGDSNVACVVAGRRTFTLFPPDQTANLYPGPIEHTAAGPQMSLVNVLEPDFTAHPRYAEALDHALVAEMEPGDALYIPPLWWHYVQAHSAFNVLVNYWWRERAAISREPMEALVLSLLSVRQLPEAERAAWKSLFDYFIFQTDGPPMAHLPDEFAGVLGPISEDRARQIWAHLMSLLRKPKG